MCEERGIFEEVSETAKGRRAEAERIFAYFLPKDGSKMLGHSDFLSLDMQKLAVKKAFRSRLSVHTVTDDRRRESKRVRASVVERYQDEKKANVASASLPEFLQHVRRIYDNIPRTWRFLFDVDASGKTSRSEFIVAARDGANFNGDILGLFKQLDEDDSGIISLNELDPTCYQELEEFQNDVEAVRGGGFWVLLWAGGDLCQSVPRHVVCQYSVYTTSCSVMYM